MEYNSNLRVTISLPFHFLTSSLGLSHQRHLTDDVLVSLSPTSIASIFLQMAVDLGNGETLSSNVGELHTPNFTSRSCGRSTKS